MGWGNPTHFIPECIIDWKFPQPEFQNKMGPQPAFYSRIKCVPNLFRPFGIGALNVGYPILFLEQNGSGYFIFRPPEDFLPINMTPATVG